MKARKYGPVRTGARAAEGTNDDVFDKFFPKSDPPAEIEPLTKIEPVSIPEPVQEITPVEIQTPLESTPAPLQNEPVIKSEPLQNLTGVVLLPDNSPHLRFPYEVFDKILRQFEPGPRVVLEELYRLSAGWDSNECTISIPKLCARCNIKPATIRLHLRKLQERGYIERLDNIVGGAVYEGRGIRFRVLLPRMNPSRKRTPSENVTPSKSEPIKVKDIKNDKKGAVITCEKCEQTGGFLYPNGIGGGGVVKCSHK